MRAGAASGPNFPFVAVRGSAAVVKGGRGERRRFWREDETPGAPGGRRCDPLGPSPDAESRGRKEPGEFGSGLREAPCGGRAGRELEEELAAVRRVGAVKEPALPGGGFVAPMRADRGCSRRSDTALPTLIFPSSFFPWISEASREKGALKVAAIRGWHGLRCCASSVCPRGCA